MFSIFGWRRVGMSKKYKNEFRMFIFKEKILQKHVVLQKQLATRRAVTNQNAMLKPIICWSKKKLSQRYLDLFERNAIEISSDSSNWDVFFPSPKKTNEVALGALKATKGKYIGVVSGTDCMVNRTGVWRNLVRAYGREKAAAIMPETFVLRKDKDLKLLKKDSRNHFILKSNKHRRLGLVLVETVEKVFEQKKYFEIAQPLMTYLQRYQGTSFNFRVYVLLTLHENKLVSYLYKEGLCIYGKLPGDAENLFERMVTHVKNGVPDGFPVLMQDMIAVLDGSKTAFFELLEAKIVELLDACYHEFGRYEHLQKAQCFQIFGVDVLLDSNKNPVICEVNKGPSMKSKNEIHSLLKDAMLDEMLSVIGLKHCDKNEFKKLSVRTIIL